MTLVIYLLLTFLFLFWVVFPMVSVGPQQAKTRDEVDNEERTQALLHSLGKLYASREKIDDSDFPNMERRLMLELSRLYHAAGINSNGKSNKMAASSPADAKFCHRCGKGREAHFKYCPACGTGAQAA